MDLTPLTHSESVVVNAIADEVYAVVSDVTRTGEWSPVCTSCWWDEGARAEVGAWFTGHNELPDRVWETRSVVVAADPGREFAWMVNGKLVRWGYVLEPLDGSSTELTETWEFTVDGLQSFHDKYGERAEDEIAERQRLAKAGIPATLAAIKAVVEAS